VKADDAAALAAIDAEYGEPVVYAGGGLSEPKTIDVIWSDVAGDTFQGAGNTVRIISAEVQQADLLAEPAKSERHTRGGIVWQPNDSTRRDDIGKWVVILKQVP
jgi:hypothetical protein